jgi:hypothetical protein
VWMCKAPHSVPLSCCSFDRLISHAPALWTILQEEVVALLRQESKGAPVRIPAPRRRVRVTHAGMFNLTCSFTGSH